MGKPTVGSWRVARAVIAVQCGVLAACASNSATPESDGGKGTRADSSADVSGPDACTAAGGECLALSLSETCSRVGPPDCNPGQYNRHWVCCLGSISNGCTDANVQMIQVSSYDRSCKSASDCIAVVWATLASPACSRAPTAPSVQAQKPSTWTTSPRRRAGRTSRTRCSRAAGVALKPFHVASTANAVRT
jgi:hypothetical protein